MLLAGDIGGTKTVLASYEVVAGGALRELRDGTFPSRDFPDGLESIVQKFLSVGPSAPITSACFGVAGAVVDGRCTTTNLPWILDERTLTRSIPAGRVKLLNDLEAAAWGVLAFGPSERVTLQAGTARAGNLALIAAGTGLGEALIPWDGTRHRVMASEGGHSDFAPRDDREVRLFQWLAHQFGHVSYERVLSGPGLFNIYRFLVEAEGAPRPAWLAERLEREDPSACIAEVGLAGKDPASMATLDLFASIYGAEAGNLALKGLAVGGLWVGGGVAPKLRTKLEDGTFVRAFCDKGRFATLMSSIPVHLALNPRAPLLGAARIAAEPH